MTTPPGGARTISSGGSRIYSYNNISTTPAQVIGPDPYRASATFHNPGTIDIFIAPVNVQNGGSDAALTPSNSSLGGCLRIFANGGEHVITGGMAQQAWQAFAVSGTTNALTVMDSKV